MTYIHIYLCIIVWKKIVHLQKLCSIITVGGIDKNSNNIGIIRYINMNIKFIVDLVF